jgi:acetyl-CoA carboxylase biotin carboxylase subunit
LEETPSPILTPELREKMGEAAVAASKSVNYEGAGTIEFLVDDKLNFYFLEMNTRLQVEHPITERVIGIDLVKEQIRIANGDVLPYKQKEIRMQGHAIECRIYAEDPDNNFMPSPGMIRYISEPNGLGVRVDGYVYQGYEIPIYYDPMISKLIVHSRTRKGAIDRMKRALFEYKISGVKTSIKFLNNIITHPSFIEGKYDTHFIEKHYNELFNDTNPCEFDCEDIAAITSFIHYVDKLETIGVKDTPQNGIHSAWKTYGRSKGIVRI